MLLVSCGSPLVAAEQASSHKIPQSVTVECLPNIQPILLVSKEVSKLPWGLMLHHTLKFDGREFHSRLWIPAFQSCLLMIDARRYEWRSPQGKAYVLTLDDETTGGWHLKRVGAHAEHVVIAPTGEQFSYEGTMLTRFSSSAGIFLFRYNGDRLAEIEQIEPVKRDIAKFNYLDGGQTLRVTFANADLSLTFGCFKNILDCELDGKLLVHAEYGRGLIRRLEVTGRANVYEWTHCDDDNMARLAPLPPVLCWDGFHRYRCRVENAVLIVQAFRSDGTEQARWRMNLASGKVRMD